MTPFEILKNASRVVAAMIVERTPDPFQTCRAAYNELEELTVYAKKAMDDATLNEGFVEGINSVIKRLEPLRAYAGGEPGKVEKRSVEDFMAFFQVQVDKAIEEDVPAALARLHGLKVTVDKAVASWEGDNAPGSVNTYYYVDPWQQASIEQVGGGPKKVTSGVANQAEVKATPGISVDDVMKSVVEKVDKKSKELKSLDIGWSRDLASPQFLRGERSKVDFGRDWTK